MSAEVEYWLSQAKDASCQGHWEQAVLYAEEGLLFTPQAASLHALLAQLYAEQQFFEQARPHYEAARAYAPENSAYTLALIDDYLRAGEGANALVYLQDLLSHAELAEFSTEVLWRLGKTFFMMGRWQDALLACSEVFAQVLPSSDNGPEAIQVICYILEILLYKHRYQRAEQLLNHLPQAMQNHVLIKSYRARLAYWAGHFVQARESWREVLSETFDEAAFGALHFLGPPVMQSEADAVKWDDYLNSAADLFEERPVLTASQDYTLFNPFDFVLSYGAPERERLALWGAWYQRHFPDMSDVSSGVSQPAQAFHIGVVVDGFDSLTCAFLLPWLQHYQLVQPPYQLTVFYLVGDDLPTSFHAYAHQLYQLPVQGQAALGVLAQAELRVLLYASLRGLLYRLAMTPPKGVQQYLYPLHQYTSGLPQLSQHLVHALTQARLYWHTQDVILPGGFTRSALRLPTLGHLYCFAFAPFGWTPEMDKLAEAILQQDRKAFIVGFTHPESTWHVRLQQRLEQSLSRPQRVRWIAFEQAFEALSLMDRVIAVARPESEFMATQAFAQGKITGYLRSKRDPLTPFGAALEQQAGDCLHEDVFSLANFLTASAGHVRLENTNFSVPNPHDWAAWDAILLSLEASL